MSPDDFAAILDTWPPTNRTNAHTVLGAMPPPDDLVRAAVNLAPLLLDLWRAAIDVEEAWDRDMWRAEMQKALAALEACDA